MSTDSDTTVTLALMGLVLIVTSVTLSKLEGDEKMAHFYATAQGSAAEAGRGGTAKTGVKSTVSNGLWRYVAQMYQEDGKDMVSLRRQHIATGRWETIGQGPVETPLPALVKREPNG